MCVLHNYLCHKKDTMYNPPGFTDIVQPDGSVVEGFWRSQTAIAGLKMRTSKSSTVAGSHVRAALTTYFNSDAGAVPWQLHEIHKR